MLSVRHSSLQAEVINPSTHFHYPAANCRSTWRIASSTSQVRSARCSGWPADIQPSTRFWAETTVLWLRRPKKWPISLKAARVCLRASHMASIRGWLTRVDLSSACRLAGSRPKTSQTAFSISPNRTTRLLWWIISPSASSAKASVIGRPNASLVACKRQSAPESSRAWFVSFAAMYSCSVLRELQLHPPRQLADDAQPRGIVGRIDAADHSAGQSRGQFRPQFGQFGRRAVGGEHQLPAFAHQRVDRVQQFDLRGPLADEKLQIVENQQAHAAILAAETRQAAAAQGFEKMAGELFRREIDRGRIAGAFADRRPNAFQEMRFADAGRTVNQKRRDLARLANDHFGRGQRQFVRLPHHERFQARRIFVRPQRADFRNRRTALASIAETAAIRNAGCSATEAGRRVAAGFEESSLGHGFVFLDGAKSLS